MRTPPEWATAICRQFGKTGQSWKYRLMWAPDRLEYCFGEQVPAYPHVGERWILEVLVPWAKFGAWNHEAFGPKPEDGEYCHSHTIEYVVGEGRARKTAYLSLEDYGAETLRLLVTCVERSKLISAWQMKTHRQHMLEEEEKREHERFSDLWDEIQGVGRMGGPLGENAISGIPGKKGSSDVKIVTLDDLSPELRRRLRCRPGSVRQVTQ